MHVILHVTGVEWVQDESLPVREVAVAIRGRGYYLCRLMMMKSKVKEPEKSLTTCAWVMFTTIVKAYQS